jgi:hypothetical protein
VEGRGQGHRDVSAVLDQCRQCEGAVDAAQYVAGVLAGQRELHREQAQQGPGEPAGKPQREQGGNAEQGLCCGEQKFLDLAPVQVQGPTPAAGEVGQRKTPDQQRPLVDLAGDQDADGRGAIAPDREEDRDDELRGLRRQRREPLHEQELINPQLGAGADQ